MPACSWNVLALASIWPGSSTGRVLERPLGIAHARGVVADDQHHRVAEVLELAQLLEHDREPEVDVRRGGVDAQLHAQRTAQFELVFEPSVGQAIDGVTREPGSLRAGRLLVWTHPAQC